jgi:hypothetical protein
MAKKALTMTKKDQVVVATDCVTEALKALVRINYDNEKQTSGNLYAAAELLQAAAMLLKGE